MNYKSENEELDKFRTDIILADKDSGKLVSNKLRFIYLVLPLFEKKVDECDIYDFLCKKQGDDNYTAILMECV